LLVITFLEPGAVPSALRQPMMLVPLRNVKIEKLLPALVSVTVFGDEPKAL
jgi:hypothetical protein